MHNKDWMIVWKNFDIYHVIINCKSKNLLKHLRIVEPRKNAVYRKKYFSNRKRELFSKYKYKIHLKYLMKLLNLCTTKQQTKILIDAIRMILVDKCATSKL